MNVLGADAEERNLRRLFEWIEQRENLGVLPRDVVRAGVAGIKKSEEAKALLDLLAQRGEGEWRSGEVRPSGQREVDRFFLLL